MKRFLVRAAVGTTLAVAASAAYGIDFGQKVEALLKAQSVSLFGTLGTLGASSTASVSAVTANADALTLVTVAPGLTAKVVSAATNLGANIDMMALWPNDTAPTHLIVCNEQGAAQVGVQRVNITTGVAEDIISSGLSSCDPIEITPWGTILAGEEAGINGRVFEILDPLGTTGVTVTGTLGTTVSSDPTKVAYRPALGALSFEGIGVYPNGVIYLSDERRPGTALTGGNANRGGSIFKFIPSTLWTAGAPAITDLTNSPLVSGSLFGLRIGRNSGNTDFGWGNEFGRGTWQPVTGTAPINLALAASNLNLTAYYRPEDIDLDLKALAAGNVRFCGANTGQDTSAATANGANHWGVVYCIRDGSVSAAGANTSIPEYQPLVFGTPDFGMPDNLAYQPGKGNWIVHEDGEGASYTPARNNDIWSCLDDGADADILSDGCVKVVTLNDLVAESTGGVFDATGKRFFFSVQHNVTGHGVIIEVNGWQ